MTSPSSSNLSRCLFVSDLHGHVDRYNKLLHVIRNENPRAVFLGGDLYPPYFSHFSISGQEVSDFGNDFLMARFSQLRTAMGEQYPEIFIILGNDDLRTDEETMHAGEKEKLWRYMHNRRVEFGEFVVYGYAFVPPTPFRLKDWERYDVSRYVDPNCIPPEEGLHTVPFDDSRHRVPTIKDDLEQLAGNENLSRTIFLFHSPPYRTNLDRAALDGRKVDHAPLDVHVGSIAVRRFIEERQPLVTLHGHVHESARITGSWKDRIGTTHSFTAAHDGPELALVRFSPAHPEDSTRELL